MAKSKVFLGIIWASTQKIGNLLISFVANMVLARLLTPSDFGTIGMLHFFIAITQTLVDSGFGSALIQKKEINQFDISTVFSVNMIMSLLLYTIVFFISPIISSFYGIPILCDLLRALCLVVIINALGHIQQSLLTRDLDFKKLSICNIVGGIIGAVAAIIAAYFGLGVWSLVIKTLLTALVTNSLLWLASHWHPTLTVNKQSFNDLFSFGGYMMLSNLILNISTNIQGMIIGKFFAPSYVGNFTQAKSLRNIASDGISAVIGNVLYPDFSKHQENNMIINSRLNKSISLLAFIVVPLMLLLILVADNLIPLVYGPQWNDAVSYFKILCIGGIPLCLQRVNASVIQAKGKSKLFFLCNLFKLSIYIPFLIVAAKYWGMIGFMIVMTSYSFISYIIFALLSSYCIKSSIFPQIIYLLQYTVISVCSFGCVFYLNLIISNHTSSIIVLFLDIILFIVIYLLISFICKVSAFKELLSYFIK